MDNKYWAIVNDFTNIVVNTIVWDGDSGWEPPEGTSAIDITHELGVSIGWYYNVSNSTFYPTKP